MMAAVRGNCPRVAIKRSADRSSLAPASLALAFEYVIDRSLVLVKPLQVALDV